MKPFEPYHQRKLDTTSTVVVDHRNDVKPGLYISPMGCVYTLFVVWFFIAYLLVIFNLGKNAAD